MSVLVNFNIGKLRDFWKLNPQFLIKSEFKELYSKDKSKDKKDSSKIMWAIALLVEKENNEYSEYYETQRKELIQTDFLKNDEFDWDSYKCQIDAYFDIRYSKLERDLRIWEFKIEERNKFIQDTPYDLKNADTLDKIWANSEKIYKVLDILREKVDKEKGGGETKEGVKESPLERGML